MKAPHHDRSPRRRQGVYYTPEVVVADMVERALAGRSAPARVLEPSVGDGRFLRALAARLPEAELWGLDCDPAALAAARRALGGRARLVEADALDWLAPPNDEAGLFDLVIGNPPYGVFRPDDPARLRASYPLHRGQFDRYRLFLEAGLSRLTPGGRLVLLLPTTWQTLQHAAPLRAAIAEHYSLRAVVPYDGDPFPEAEVRVAAFVIDRVPGGGLAPRQASEAAHAVAARLRNELPRLDARFRVVSGCKPYQRGKGRPLQSGAEGRARAFETTGPADAHCRPLLVGRHVRPYTVAWEPDSWLRYGPWLAEPRDAAVFDAPWKIVGRQTGDRLVAGLDEAQRVARDSTWLVLPRPETLPDDLLWLLAVLNDPIATGLFRLGDPDEVGKSFAQVRIGSVRRLPCPPLSRLRQPDRAQAPRLVHERVAAKDEATRRRLDEALHSLVREAFALSETEEGAVTQL